jgi:hypothetical protein
MDHGAKPKDQLSDPLHLRNPMRLSLTRQTKTASVRPGIRNYPGAYLSFPYSERDVEGALAAGVDRLCALPRSGTEWQPF